MPRSLGMSLTTFQSTIKHHVGTVNPTPWLGIKFTFAFKEVISPAHDVVETIEDNDHSPKNQIIVIGAHYDHLGADQNNCRYVTRWLSSLGPVITPQAPQDYLN
jgi:hypothetical protein